jgi:hypothetical protein
MTTEETLVNGVILIGGGIIGITFEIIFGVEHMVTIGMVWSGFLLCVTYWILHEEHPSTKGGAR